MSKVPRAKAFYRQCPVQSAVVGFILIYVYLAEGKARKGEGPAANESMKTRLAVIHQLVPVKDNPRKSPEISALRFACPGKFRKESHVAQVESSLLFVDEYWATNRGQSSAKVSRTAFLRIDSNTTQGYLRHIGNRASLFATRDCGSRLTAISLSLSLARLKPNEMRARFILSLSIYLSLSLSLSLSLCLF
jgi:hypothetical protein